MWSCDGANGSTTTGRYAARSRYALPSVAGCYDAAGCAGRLERAVFFGSGLHERCTSVYWFLLRRAHVRTVRRLCFSQRTKPIAPGGDVFLGGQVGPRPPTVSGGCVFHSNQAGPSFPNIPGGGVIVASQQGQVRPAGSGQTGGETLRSCIAEVASSRPLEERSLFTT